MRLLLTSDSQAERSNLDLCEQSLEELLAAAAKYRPDAIIHGGDAKDSYSPVDVLVVNFWVRAIKKITSAGYPFYINLGNHDRISQSQETRNWFPVLRAAGAIATTKPSVKKIGDGHVAFLPFTANKQQEHEWADTLARETNKLGGFRALVFHCEVAGAKMGVTAANGITPEDLRCKNYEVCLGGHLHEHQLVEENVWYIGSPFCQDWSEANQTKGLVLYDSVKGVKQLKTSIPGFYDTEYLESKGIEPEAGAYIRSRVPVTSKKIMSQLREEEERILRTFPASQDLRLFVIPKLQASKTLEVPIAGKNDLEAVENYVAATHQDASGYVARRVVAYLASKLHKIDPGASGKQIKFVKIEGSNVLVFPHVEFRYSKQGLVLLKGVNRDWPKKSIGSGKTSLLSLLLIALFGETLKEQKNDDWACERNSDPAEVTLWFRDERDRKIKVVRGRRKHKLLLYVNGEDVSSGITGKGKTQTQGQIEELTGFDLRMLLNSVYIDQTIANGFVFGTQKDRMDLVNKLQNLGRYDAALKLVTKDMKRAQESLQAEQSRAEHLVEEVSRLEQDLECFDDTRGKSWKTEYQKGMLEVDRLKKAKGGLEDSKQYYETLQAECDAVEAEGKLLEESEAKAHGEVMYWQKREATGKQLLKKGVCGVCEQPVTSASTAMIKDAASNLKKATAKWIALTDSVKAKAKKFDAMVSQIERYEVGIGNIATQLEAARSTLQTIRAAYEEEQKRDKKDQEKIASLRKQLNHSNRLLRACRTRTKDLDVDIEMLDYAMKAFHRSGMPLYLSAALCPLLNKAAEEYSEIFTDGKLNIEFAVIDGEFSPQIINPSGSETGKGQSEGESAMAGMIAALAVREAAPKTNILLLDNPAHGLDEQSAKQFAKGLLRLKSRFETVIITTHSPVIEGALGGEAKVWTVTKKNGLSQLRVS